MDELLIWLKRAGCVYVFVGLESLKGEALTQIGKPNLLDANAEGYRRRLANLHRHRLGIYGSFIVGLDQVRRRLSRSWNASFWRRRLIVR
jgi:radical SAM superfamily enzyme YgiQ (UPF0313 family)